MEPETNEEINEEQTNEGELSEEQLAEEALKATDETAGTAPLSVVEDLREARRALREENAELRGRLTALESKAKEEPAEKSPMEKWADEHEDLVNDYSIPASVAIAQKKWEDSQAAKKAKAQAEETNAKELTAFQEQSMEKYSEANVGIGLDYETIVKIGGHLLEESDKKAIANAKYKGVNPFDLAYEKILKRIAFEGGTLAEKIKARQEAHKALQAKKNTNTKKKKAEPDETNKEETGDEEQTDFTPLTQFIFGE